MEFKMKEVGFSSTLEFGELQVAGDEKFGFRPYQLMVSSIAACSGSVLRKILEKKRIVFRDVKIIAKVERNEDKANKIEKIALHYIIEGSNLKEQKIKQAIELASKHCPMAQSVKNSIEITETFELKERGQL